MVIRNPVSLFWPNVTIPDIYADRRVIAPGESIDGLLHQWRLAYTFGGACKVQTDNEDFMVARGDMYLTCARVWMNLRVCDSTAGESWDTAYAVFHPRPHWHAWLDMLGFRDGLVRLHFEEPERGEIEESLLRLVEVYRSENLLRDDLALLALESILLKLHAHNAQRQMAPDERIRAALEYIHAHYNEPLTGPMIARAACVSVPHLSALFSAATGATPGQYLERVRLERAAGMLRFSVSNVAEIASASGYTDPNYFARRFRHQYGQTPREYRAASRPENV